MNEDHALIPRHPLGEQPPVVATADRAVPVDTYAGRIDVAWEPDAAVTPLGQLPFFIEFLKQAGLFDGLVGGCPIQYTSPNAPSKRDLLGTVLLSILSGHWRYAHITALRSDTVTPPLLGMRRVLSEDAVRRGLAKIDPMAGAAWLQENLDYVTRPLLREPWILDVDTTVKPLFGHQEGAVVGYNPGKPVHHTGSKSLPVDGPLGGAGGQLVEPVRTAGRPGPSPRSDHQPAIVADRDRASNHPRRAYHAARQQFAWTASVGPPGLRAYRRVLRGVASNRGAVDPARPVVPHPQSGARQIPPWTPTRTTKANSAGASHSYGLNNSGKNRRYRNPTAEFRVIPANAGPHRDHGAAARFGPSQE